MNLMFLTKHVPVSDCRGRSKGLLTTAGTPQQETIWKCLEVSELANSATGRGNKSLCHVATATHKLHM
jgi:hypothetical protein